MNIRPDFGTDPDIFMKWMMLGLRIEAVAHRLCVSELRRHGYMGIDGPQALLLYHLRHGGYSQQEVVRRGWYSDYYLSVGSRKLEDGGYITRPRMPGHKKALMLVPTNLGMKAVVVVEEVLGRIAQRALKNTDREAKAVTWSALNNLEDTLFPLE